MEASEVILSILRAVWTIVEIYLKILWNCALFIFDAFRGKGLK